jgi:hypothetical protein
LCDVLEEIINYKIALRYYKYLEAWKHFLNIFSYLNLDNFDMAMYYNSTYTGSSHNQPEEDDFNSSKKRIKKNLNDSFNIMVGMEINTSPLK